jgi:aminoacrylate hydrolase
MFITGLSGFASFWHEQVAAFARKFDVITHDHRGIGQSDHTVGGYTVDRMAGDVLGLMDALKIERAHVVGHSTGGAILQTLAISHPDRIASAVISASWTKADAYFRRLFELRKDVLRRLGPEGYLRAATLFLYPPWWIACKHDRLLEQEAAGLEGFSDPAIIERRIDAILAFDRTDDLPQIRSPCLVVGAADDAVTPAYYSEELARRIPGAELKLLPRGGHCFTQTVPRDFDHAVLPFLAAHTPPA